MSRLAAFAALLLLLSAGIARAQTTTADGVLAYAAGDYDRAAAILRPLAGSSAAPDSVAAFFMAMLYDTGRGVPADPMRACALFLRAGLPSGRESPVTAAARFLFGAPSFFPTDPDALDECSLLAVDGPDPPFAAVTFQLEAAQWIDWDFRGATVTYQGKSTRFPVRLSFIGGTVFLPLRHTVLATGPQRSARRHFIDAAAWQPADRTGKRHLQWHLFEVVRDRLLTITVEDVASADGGADASALAAFDLRDAVRVDVNDAGDAEWSVAASAVGQTHVIPTEADRAAEDDERARLRLRNQARARALKAAAAVVSDVNRAPSLTYVADDVEGCGWVSVAGWSVDRTEAIVVRADATADRGTQVFDLSHAPSTLSVVVHVSGRAVGSDPFCTDILNDAGEERVWRAVSGTVTVAVGPQAGADRNRRLSTVTVADAEFIGPTGERIRLTAPVTLTAAVGTLF